jgi:hypothetical protein
MPKVKLSPYIRQLLSVSACPGRRDSNWDRNALQTWVWEQSTNLSHPSRPRTHESAIGPMARSHALPPQDLREEDWEPLPFRPRITGPIQCFAFAGSVLGRIGLSLDLGSTGLHLGSVRTPLDGCENDAKLGLLSPALRHCVGPQSHHHLRGSQRGDANSRSTKPDVTRRHDAHTHSRLRMAANLAQKRTWAAPRRPPNPKQHNM